MGSSVTYAFGVEILLFHTVQIMIDVLLSGRRELEAFFAAHTLIYPCHGVISVICHALYGQWCLADY